MSAMIVSYVLIILSKAAESTSVSNVFQKEHD